MKFNFDKTIDRFHTDSIKYDKLKEHYGIDNLLPMWVADMDFASPPCITEAIVKRTQHAIFGYSFRSDECISNIQEWLKTRHNWLIQPEWITSSPGIVTALSLLIMSLTDKKDKIAIQPPVYQPFFNVIKDTNRELHLNPLKLIEGKYVIDFDHLIGLAKNGLKAIIICNPHNPVGRVWNKYELLKLGQIAEEYDFLIISDEIHQDLIYTPHKHIPIASLSPEIANRTITCIAPSKTFNVAGLASSVVIIPNSHIKMKYDKLLTSLHLENGNIFGHIAMQAGYGEGEEWLDALLQYLKENLDFIREYLKKNLPQLRLIEPQATFLAWIDFSSLELSSEQFNKIISDEEGVALSPGTCFGIEGEGFTRLNFGCPRSTLKIALLKIHKKINSISTT